MKNEYFLPGGSNFTEVKDQKGKPIKGIVAIQVYKDSIVVATKEKLFTNKPELFPGMGGMRVVKKGTKKELKSTL